MDTVFSPRSKRERCPLLKSACSANCSSVMRRLIRSARTSLPNTGPPSSGGASRRVLLSLVYTCRLPVRGSEQMSPHKNSDRRSEEHTSELQYTMRITYADLCQQ